MQLNSATNLKVIEHLTTVSRAAGTNSGTGIDTAGWQEAIIILTSGTTSTSGTLDVKIQDAPDNSTWADVTGAAFTQITPSNDEQSYYARIKLTPYTAGTTDKVERYIRATATGATAASIFGVSVILVGYGFGAAFTAQTYAFNID